MRRTSLRLMTITGLPPNAAALLRLAEDLGLEPQPIMERMNAPEVTKVIEDNHKLAQALNVSGTPTFVIDGTFVRGYVPLDGMRQIVAGQRG